MNFARRKRQAGLEWEGGGFDLAGRRKEEGPSREGGEEDNGPREKGKILIVF
jgi:hypothetical protein